MSRSNPTLMNPAQRILEWSGSTGRLTWYDKQEEKDVIVELPFSFMVLDELSTITGWNSQHKSRFWSNEVRSISKDTLFVRTKQGPFESGKYSELTESRAKGGKYTKVIYIAFMENDEWIIGKIMAVGSCLSAWIDFAGKNKTQEGMLSITSSTAEDGPMGKYYPPKFIWGKCTPGENNQAIVMDIELQKFLKVYLATPRDEEGREIEPDGFEPSQHDQAATVSRSEMPSDPNPIDDSEPSGPPDKVITDIDDGINLDEIPF